MVLEQCRLLLQYVEQQDPAKFVRARHAKIAKSVATHLIEYSIYEARQQKKLTNFFHQREREPRFIRGEQIVWRKK